MFSRTPGVGDALLVPLRRLQQVLPERVHADEAQAHLPPVDGQKAAAVVRLLQHDALRFVVSVSARQQEAQGCGLIHHGL